MCVIMASETTRVTKDQLESGFKENPWGAGIAWIDKDKDGPLVRWKKGIATAAEAWDLFQSIPEKSPYVLHFRIPTEGLSDMELNHPFGIDAAATSEFEGTTRGTLLFHNGGMGDWRLRAMEICRTFATKLPKGLLSDSRIIAWMAHWYGEEVLQIVNEKVVAFGLVDGAPYLQYYGMDKQNGWNFIGDRDKDIGVWCSNDRWEKHMPKPAPTPGTYPTLKEIKAGRGGDQRPGAGSFQPSGQPGAGRTCLPSGSQQEQVEGCEATVHPRPEPDGKLVNDPAFIAKLATVHPETDQLAWALQLNPKKYTRRSAGFIASATQTVH